MFFRLLLCFVCGMLWGCYAPERDCQAFRNGSFTFTTEVLGEKKTTTFVRDGQQEIDYYEGKQDTSLVRWINDCEYVVKKLHPRNRSEEQSIHMKILSTTENSYTFEYKLVGKAATSRGTAIKTN